MIHPGRSVTTRLVLYFLAVSLLSLGLLGVLAYGRGRAQLREAVFEKLDAVASVKERELLRWLEDRRGQVVFLSTLPGIHDNGITLLRSEPGRPGFAAAYANVLQRVLSLKSSSPNFQDITLMSASGGLVRFSTNPRLEGDYRPTDTYFLQGREGTYVQNVYQCPVTLQPTITVATPLVDRDGRLAGVLAAHLNVDMLEAVAQEKTGLGMTAETYLVTRNHLFLSSLRGREDAYRRGVHSRGIDAAVAGADGAMVYVNHLGVPVVGVYRWIEGLELALVTEVTQVEAFQKASGMALTLFAIGAAVIVLVSAGIPVVARRITRPILDVRDASLRMARGDLSSRAAVAARDEVGEVASSFNLMADRVQELYTSLQRKEAYFRSLFETSPEPIAVTRIEDGTFVDVNGAFCAFCGYPREELVGRSILEVGLWSVPADRERLLSEVAEGGVVPSFEARYRRKDGADLVVLISAKLIELEQGACLLGILRDVTTVKRAEEALIKSERQYRELVESVRSVVLRWDPQGRITFMNRFGEEFFGYPQEELLGRPAVGTIVPLTESSGRDLSTVIDDICRNPERYSLNENENLRKDGTRVWVSWTNRGILDPQGNLLEILSVGNDITPRKQAEEQLRASLREKEVLLKEIHHRVKNNLQVIGGLLNLQQKHIPDREARVIYKESQNRVITMALIHEELYRSKDLSQVDMEDYLRTLAQNLMVSYGVDVGRVTLRLDVEAVRLVVDTAIPCGLIANELISNALKHAFPSGRTGRLGVEFRGEGGGFLLRVSDDGVGFPADLDFRGTKSLGLQLVTVMAEQMRGSVELERSGGTAFTVRFLEHREAGTVLY